MTSSSSRLTMRLSPRRFSPQARKVINARFDRDHTLAETLLEDARRASDQAGAERTVRPIQVTSGADPVSCEAE